MKREFKVSVFVRGNIVCTGNCSASYPECGLSVLLCSPDAEIPERFIRRVYFGPEPEDCDKIEYDLRNAVEIRGDLHVESLHLKGCSSILATGSIVFLAHEDYQTDPVTGPFCYEPLEE